MLIVRQVNNARARPMKDESLHGTTCLVLITGIILLFAPCVSSARKLSTWEHASPGEQSFKLRPTSVFKINPELRLYFAQGLWIGTQETPLPEIKAFPKFKSSRPLYGRIVLGAKTIPVQAPGGPLPLFWTVRTETSPCITCLSST